MGICFWASCCFFFLHFYSVVLPFCVKNCSKLKLGELLLSKFFILFCAPHWACYIFTFKEYSSLRGFGNNTVMCTMILNAIWCVCGWVVDWCYAVWMLNKVSVSFRVYSVLTSVSIQWMHLILFWESCLPYSGSVRLGLWDGVFAACSFTFFVVCCTSVGFFFTNYNWG